MTDVRSARVVVISKVEISVFAHATEDEEKVERAVLNMIPKEFARPRPKVQRLKGHHNDPLVRMTMRITKRSAAVEMFRSLMRSLSPPDRRRLLDEAVERVDKSGNLYLRLDKQRAYRGGAVLHETDSIRMKFGFRAPHGVDPVSYVRTCVAEVGDEVEHEAGFLNQ